MKDVTSSTLTAEMQKRLQDILSTLQTANPTDPAVNQLQQQIKQQQNSLQQVQQMQQMLEKATEDAAKFNQTSDSGVQAVDRALAGDFSADDRTTASAFVGTHTLASPALVVESIVAEHPSAATAAAFMSAVKLATSATYSHARAQARFTLAVAFVFGQRVLRYDLKSSGAKLTLAQGKATLKFHSRRKLTLAANPLGARILRLLEIGGLAKKITIQLVVSSNHNGKVSHAARTLRVR
jgi:hypothetical protein